MFRRETFTQCVKLAEHYLAIGQTNIYLDECAADTPWHLATKVEAGGSYRLNGPASARVTASHESGLTFSWSFDFEGRDANGTGVNQFDAQKLLAIAARMPATVRDQFADFLNAEVWPAVKKNTEEVRGALRKQEDSLSVLQSIIISVGKQVAA